MMENTHYYNKSTDDTNGDGDSDNNGDDDTALVPMTEDELNLYAATCAQHLPTALRGKNYLLTNIKWRRQMRQQQQQQQQQPQQEHQERKLISFNAETTSAKCSVRFFRPSNGLPVNCTFVAISKKKDYCVFIFTLEQSNDELFDCLRRTKRIKWHLGPFFVSVELSNQFVVRQITAERNDVVEFEVDNDSLWLPKDEAANLKFELPDEVYLDQLAIDDAALINSVWPHQNTGSLAFIRTLITLNGGLGIYSKSTKELLAWIIKNDNGALGVLQTATGQRRKGFATILVRAMSKRLAVDDELEPVAFIVATNIVSLKLFGNCGFRKFGKVSWIKIKSTTVPV